MRIAGRSSAIVRVESPSLARGFFFNLKRIPILLVCSAFFCCGALTNALEKKEELQGQLLGKVSLVRENFITFIYGSDAGTELEIGFQRHSEIRLVHKRNWSEIRPGEMVFARFVEYRRVREGRDDEGVLRKESEVLERRLISLEFEEPEKKTLISGDGQ